MVQQSKLAELEHNYRAFTQVLPTLLPAHEGKCALMRHGTVVGCFDNAGEALKAGRNQFPDDLFSVQVITDKKADLGWFSRAPDSWPL